MLDETDSGLDIDAVRIVAEGVNALRGPDRAMLVITHYQRLLELHRARPGACAVGRARGALRRALSLRSSLKQSGYAEFGEATRGEAKSGAATSGAAA